MSISIHWMFTRIESSYIRHLCQSYTIIIFFVSRNKTWNLLIYKMVADIYNPIVTSYICVNCLNTLKLFSPSAKCKLFRVPKFSLFFFNSFATSSFSICPWHLLWYFLVNFLCGLSFLLSFIKECLRWCFHIVASNIKATSIKATLRNKNFCK